MEGTAKKIPGVGTQQVNEGGQAAKTELWYGDAKAPIFINLTNASRMKLDNSLIRVYHGRDRDDIDCETPERARFLFGYIVQHLLDTARVLAQPREMTQEERDEAQRNALNNGAPAAPVSPASKVSGVDPGAKELDPTNVVRIQNPEVEGETSSGAGSFTEEEAKVYHENQKKLKDRELEKKESTALTTEELLERDDN